MDCTKCGKNIAVYHNVLEVNGVIKEEHLCNDCMVNSFNSTKVENFFNPIISSNCCKTCGHTFEEFLNTGNLGCPDCYNSFKERLEPVITKLQGSLIHYGKANIKGLTEEEKEYMELNRQLKQAVKMEDYELASSLKEQILKLRDIDGYK